MRAKILLVALLMAVVYSEAEIIKLSMLKQESRRFTYKRDIFSPEKPRASSAKSGVPTVSKRIKEPEPENPADRLRRLISFEGFIFKNNRRHALLNIQGDFLVVSEGDRLPGGAVLVSIAPEKITVEFQSERIDLPLKGDNS